MSQLISLLARRWSRPMARVLARAPVNSKIRLVVSVACRVATTAVRFAVLRVVRESLTNVLKHAGAAATARVAVERTPGAVRVRVEDDGAGRALGVVAAGPGHGLGGMRERLRALDGELTAGPLPEGGFGVRATIPVTVQSVRR